MESDTKLETMEQELKLLKGELKQSLASVRDYLLNMELPSSEFTDVLEALDDDKQKIIMEGSLNGAPAKEEGKKEDEEEAIPEDTAEEMAEPEAELPLNAEDLLDDDENPHLEDELLNEPAATEEIEETENTDETGETDETDETDEATEPEDELPVLEEEEEPMTEERNVIEAGPPTPRVNLLANLMHWVSKAKREIGSEQLPAFLEVYGISGHLSPELKELILHLTDIAIEQPDDSGSAETWSQSMLSLHGILTGADTPRYAAKPLWNDYGQSAKAKPAEDKLAEVTEKPQKETPVRLKLVFPGGNGKEKEFCLDLRPETDDNET
jgi:hypothetical protein